jgi:hypothetical protein
MALEMVAPLTLVPISEETDTSFNSNNTLAFGVKCYEAGMVQVVRGIAEDHIRRFDSSDFTRRLNNAAKEKRLELEKTFNTRDYALIKEYADALSEANAGDAEDHYIQGFLDGYRYLANRIAYKGEGFDKNRFTKNDSEENE